MEEGEKEGSGEEGSEKEGRREERSGGEGNGVEESGVERKEEEWRRVREEGERQETEQQPTTGVLRKWHLCSVTLKLVPDSVNYKPEINLNSSHFNAHPHHNLTVKP